MTFEALEELDLVESLHTLLIGAADPDSFLEDVASRAVTAVDRQASCGIVIMKDGRPELVAASDTRARRIEECQHEAGGPTLAAIADDRPVEVRDHGYDDRWPSYARLAGELGVCCALAVPLRVGGGTVGAITVYGGDRPGAFGEEECRRLEVFAAQATTAIALAVQRSDQQETMHQLREALRARSVVDQAIGVLMAQERCPAEAAFDMLRQHSQHNNRKIRDVAVDVVTRVTGHPPGDPPPFAVTRGRASQRSA